MPIHDQGYRRYGGLKARTGTGWTVIARAGIRTFVTKRAFLGLLLVSWFPFFVRAVQFYAAANLTTIPQASMLAPSADTFRQFLEQQQTFVFFVTVYVGAGLIANDRRANALQIYLSRPMTSWEYIAGKLAILFFFLTLVTWVPAMGLLIVQTIFAGSFTFVRNNAYLVPAITLLSLAQVLLASTTVLALSSMSKSSRFVGVMYAGLIFFTAALFNALRAITRRSSFAWLSPTDTLQQLSDVIFRIEPQFTLSPAVAALVVLILIAGSAAILTRRVKGVEIVT